MGSSQSGNGNPGDLKLISVTTATLREKLNRIYDARRTSPSTLASSGLFDYLWEMKELALLERRQSVQVPTNWLEELEQDFSDILPESVRGN